MGTALAQLLAIVAMPVLSRLYSPGDFGALAVFMAVSSIVATAVTLRYETSILLPKKEQEAISLVLLSLALAMFLGMACGAIVWLLPAGIRATLGVSAVGGWLPVAVAAGIATAMVAIGTAWLNRQRAYLKIAQLRITQSALGALLGIGLGIYGYGAGLLAAQFVSLLVVAVIAIAGLVTMFTRWRKQDINDVARAQIAAPKYLLPTALLDVVTLQLPVLLITAWFSSEAAGQFSMAWKILALPMALVGAAVGQVFFERISADIHSNIDLVRRRYVRVSLMLGGVAIFPALLVATYGEELFEFVLGQAWGASGKMAELLVISMSMYFVFSPTTSILLVLARQKVLLGFSVLQLAYRLSAALVSSDMMEYIRLLVICEFINVVLFELVVVYFLNAGKAKAAT
jgi:O-antigen/teichoic acid export membrane protein